MRLRTYKPTHKTHRGLIGHGGCLSGLVGNWALVPTFVETWFKPRVPGAAQRETMRRRPGTPVASSKRDPASAVHHFVLHRVRGTPRMDYGSMIPGTRAGAAVEADHSCRDAAGEKTRPKKQNRSLGRSEVLGRSWISRHHVGWIAAPRHFSWPIFCQGSNEPAGGEVQRAERLNDNAIPLHPLPRYRLGLWGSPRPAMGRPAALCAVRCAQSAQCREPRRAFRLDLSV